MSDIYDIVVAGGGVTGALTAARLVEHTEQSVLIIEREAVLGGRLRSLSEANNVRGYGLAAISENLYEFWDQTLKQDPEADDLPAYVDHRQKQVGVFSAGKISTAPIQHIFSDKGARLLGGGAAARDWSRIDELMALDQEAAQQGAFSQLWKGQRKAPSAIVAEHFAGVLGIPDLWSSSLPVLQQRASIYRTGLFAGDWSKALERLIAKGQANGRLNLQSDSIIVDCVWDEGQKVWRLATARGEVVARKLVVAQSPWEAIQWLPKEHWPRTLLNVVLKTKPVSMVVLSQQLQIPDGVELPELMIVPAENVHAIFNEATNEIVFQATLDFELSLQAPAVVKAVKRLKRASRKLLKAYPEMEAHAEHLALLPIAWSQSPAHSDRRMLEKLDKQDINTPNLAFCGDAYGASYNGDENIISSVRAVMEAFAPR